MRYFFDWVDGSAVIVDDEGVEFSSPGAARHAAIEALSQRAVDVFPEHAEAAELAIVIRERGRTLFRVSLKLGVGTASP